MVDMVVVVVIIVGAARKARVSLPLLYQERGPVFIRCNETYTVVHSLETVLSTADFLSASHVQNLYVWCSYTATYAPVEEQCS
jgi:hypothetical protein